MKEDFDDILKRKWAEQHFPVDDGHREQMIALLDNKKRRGIIPFWWISSLLLIGAVAAYLLLGDETVPAPAIANGASLSTEASTSGSDTPSGSSLKSLPSTEQDSREELSQMNVGSSSSPSTSASPSSFANTSGVTGRSTLRPAAPSPSGIPSLSTSSISPDSSIKQSSKDAKSPKPVVKHPDQASVNPELHSGEDIQQDIESSDRQITPPPAVKEEEVVDVYANVTKPTPQVRPSIHLLPVAALDMDGIAYSAEHIPGPVDPMVKAKRTFYAFGETGVGMIFPSQSDYDAGWKFRAGGGLGYKLNPKVQLTLSLGYLMQSGGFDFQRSSTVDFAGFGARSSFNSLTPDRLHYVYTRVGAQYRIHRHLFGAHGGFQYLYGAQGELVTQVQDQFAPGTTETSEYTWLVTDGLRKMNWTIDISYGYQLTPRLFASAGADVFFSSNTVEDQGLTQEGYYWSGAYAPVHPFITLNYLIYEGR